ncbi:MAG TPA: LacI family DNA-binding transcriptional regulator [Propionibacteriaceae bacterium]|nr:LacI family DNA-binding transcriptional regulator [Propionibacteriaceae bacterium]
MRRATMRDVAARAGVSLKTVSRVVNLEPGVSPRLAENVQEAARELDYRHNLAARHLRQSLQRTNSLAVLVQDLSNFYSAELIRAIDDVARAREIVVISASLDEEEDRERDVVANLINRRVDGLIMMPASRDQSYLSAQIEAGFAVVIIDRPPGNLAADTVTVDNHSGAAEATAHLIAHGHRRIAVITDDQRILTAHARLSGYRAALQRAGIGPDASLVRTARTRADATSLVHGLLQLEDPPTAIFAARNAITEGAVAALQQVGASSTVALVGFDDIPSGDLLSPAVTVIRQDVAEVGRRATQLLLHRLDDRSLPPHDIVIPTELVARGSGEIRPRSTD